MPAELQPGRIADQARVLLDGLVEPEMAIDRRGIARVRAQPVFRQRTSVRVNA